MNENHFKFTPSVLLLPFFSVLILWIVFWLEVRFHLHFDEWGIYPRTLEGLRGIVCSPFLHGSIEHLYNNSIPLFILIAAIRYFYREQSLYVLGYGILISGFLTWIIGRDSYHIGASGLIYVLVSFIFFKGIRTKYYRLVALSLLVVVVYGSMIWYVFPVIDQEISWEGHLAGFVTGYIFAFTFKTPDYEKIIKYDWERPDYNFDEDKFMQRFDENGNFFNKPVEEAEDEFPLYYTTKIPVFYEIINKKNESKPES
ncbi:MAG: rhomboid family intramembrane serine protease [Bacteroidota bacterium]